MRNRGTLKKGGARGGSKNLSKSTLSGIGRCTSIGGGGGGTKSGEERIRMDNLTNALRFDTFACTKGRRS